MLLFLDSLMSLNKFRFRIHQCSILLLNLKHTEQSLVLYGKTYLNQVEPLEDWYKKGRILNITPYTDIDSVDIERIKVYKEIAFTHEVSQSFQNVEFYDTFGRQYGDLQQSYNYESSEYQVKVLKYLVINSRCRHSKRLAKIRKYLCNILNILYG